MENLKKKTRSLQTESDQYDASLQVGDELVIQAPVQDAMLIEKPLSSSSLTAEQAAANAVEFNEVGGNAATADMIRPPVPLGNSGWTIGFFQSDFNTNLPDAQALLEDGLEADGISKSVADTIASDLNSAGKSSVVTLPAGYTVESINADLQTTAAASAIQTGSNAIFSSTYSDLDTSYFSNSNIDAPFVATFSNASQGSLLRILVSDYNNQYNIGPNGPAASLLTTGSGSFGVPGQESTVTVAADATPAEVVTAWGSAVLSTQFAITNGGNFSLACGRLAEDVAQANEYQQVNGLTMSGGEVFSSAYGTCTINDTTTANGGVVSFSGTTSVNGTVTPIPGTFHGTYTTNGTSTTGSLSYLDNLSNGQSYQDLFNISDPIYEEVFSFSSTNGSGTLLATQAFLDPTLPGNVDTVTLSNATIDLGYNTNLSLSGSSDNLDNSAGNVISLTAANSDCTFENGGSVIKVLAAGDGVIASNDTVQVTDAGNDNFAGNGNAYSDSAAGTQSFNGTGNSFNGQSSDLVLLSANSSLTDSSANMVDVNGAGITLDDTATGAQINDYATGTSITASQDTIGFDIANQGATITGSKDVLDVYGSGDGITSSADTVDIIDAGSDNFAGNNNAYSDSAAGTLSFNGTGDSFSGQTGDLVLLSANSSLTDSSVNTVDVNGAGSALDDTAAGAQINDYASGSSITANQDTIGFDVVNQTGITVTGSKDVLDVYMSGDGVTASGDTVNITAAGSENFSGNNNVYSDSAAGTLSFNGTGDSFGGQSTDLVALSANSSLTDTSANTVNVNGANTTLDDTATGAQINDYSTSSYITASQDTIGFDVANQTSITVTGSKDVLDLYKSGDAVSASGDTVDISSAGNDTFAGNNNAFSDSAASTLSLIGTGNSFSGESTDLVTLAASCSLTDTSANTVNVNGANTTLTDTATGAEINDYATGSAITASQDEIGLDVANQTGISVSGSKDVLYINSSGDGVTASGDTVNIASAGGENFLGNNNVYSDSAAGTLSFNGTGDSFSGQSGDLVLLSANSSLTDSSANTVDVNGAGSALDDTATGAQINDYTTGSLITASQDTIGLDTANQTGITVSGSKDVLDVYNSGDGVTASSDTITVTGSGNDAFVGNNNNYTDSASGALSFNGTGNNFSGVSGDVAVLAAGSSLTDTSANTIDLEGAGSSVDDTATGATINDSAANDVISANNETVDVTGNLTVYVTGSHDDVIGSAGDTVHDDGQDDSVHASNSTVDFSKDDTGDDVYGKGDTGSNWAGHFTTNGGAPTSHPHTNPTSGPSSSAVHETKLLNSTVAFIKGQSSSVVGLLTSHPIQASTQIDQQSRSLLVQAIASFGIKTGQETHTEPLSRNSPELWLAISHH